MPRGQVAENQELPDWILDELRLQGHRPGRLKSCKISWLSGIRKSKTNKQAKKKGTNKQKVRETGIAANDLTTSPDWLNLSGKPHSSTSSSPLLPDTRWWAFWRIAQALMFLQMCWVPCAEAGTDSLRDEDWNPTFLPHFPGFQIWLWAAGLWGHIIQRGHCHGDKRPQELRKALSLWDLPWGLCGQVWFHSPHSNSEKIEMVRKSLKWSSWYLVLLSPSSLSWEQILMDAKEFQTQSTLSSYFRVPFRKDAKLPYNEWPPYPQSYLELEGVTITVCHGLPPHPLLVLCLFVL